MYAYIYGMVIDCLLSEAWASRRYLDGAALEEGVVELHGVVHRGLLQELHVREPGGRGMTLSECEGEGEVRECVLDVSQ